MFLIDCPCCGPRDAVEFTYEGDATVRRPPGGADAGQQAFFEYVYIRNNPRGPHEELWHHAHGCRQFLTVTRDTLTHEISKVVFASSDRRGGDK